MPHAIPENCAATYQEVFTKKRRILVGKNVVLPAKKKKKL